MTGKLEAIEPWVLELEVREVEERLGIKERGTGLSPFIKTMNIKRLLLGLKTCLFPRNDANGTVWLPTPVLMRIP